MEPWELVIVGAGPAGLAAGMYAARSGLKTLIVEEKMAGGTTADAPIVENYPGFSKISGGELAEKMVLQCRHLGVPIHELESATKLIIEENDRIVKTNKTTYISKAILLATGSHYKEIGVNGEKKFKGRGVSYCGVCDGPLFKGKRVLVVGGGNTSATTTLYLSGIVSEVFVVHRREAFRAERALVKDIQSKKNVTIFWDSEIQEIIGNTVVNQVIIVNKKTNESKQLKVDAVFVQIGEAPNNQIVQNIGINLNNKGHIITDSSQRTNIPGIYAAGDLTNHPVKQIGTAVGQGITAALEAYSYIKQPYYRK
ncbi:MAG TPA: FAD-dependent oxidoreductase [Candidatus Glassbacteria bacterium]|nr:FAD-dependent oxidoreductase [Candidatus Glassbacteria bacterium]